MLVKILDAVVDYYNALRFQQFLHAGGGSKVDAAAEFALAIHYAMRRHIALVDGAVQGPTHHTGGTEREKVGNGPIGRHPPSWDKPDDVVNIFVVFRFGHEGWI